MRSFSLLVAVCLLFFSGCSSRRETGQATRVTEEEPVDVTERAVQDRTITLAPRTQPPATPTRTERVVRESRPVAQRDQILSLRGGGVYDPEDFEIGGLQGHSDDVNIRAILQRIRSFQKGLGSALVPVDDIHPDWKEQAQRSLGFHLERGNLPTDVRVGLINIYAPGAARANIRLAGNPGTAFGEIYLEKSGEHWLVSDFQVDMQDLSKAAKLRQEPYEPSVYRMTTLP